MKKRALVVSIGILALVVSVQGAAAQYGGGPDQSYRGGPDQSYRGSGQSYGGRSQEYYGVVRYGGDCVVNTDLNRGYGFLKPCPAPQKPVRVRRQ
jgi:hypothetical protein